MGSEKKFYDERFKDRLARKYPDASPNTLVEVPIGVFVEVEAELEAHRVHAASEKSLAEFMIAQRMDEVRETHAQALHDRDGTIAELKDSREALREQLRQLSTNAETIVSALVRGMTLTQVEAKLLAAVRPPCG
jgi:hypothetical protein